MRKIVAITASYFHLLLVIFNALSPKGITFGNNYVQIQGEIKYKMPNVCFIILPSWNKKLCSPYTR